MRKILIYVIIAFGFLFSNCEEEKNDSQNSINSNNTIMVDSTLYNNSTSDDFDFTNAEIIDDSLKLTINYGGGCGGVDVKLIDSESIMESNPVQRYIKLSFKDNDDCEALITQVIFFDLSPIKISGQSKIKLNLKGWDSQLIYEY